MSKTLAAIWAHSSFQSSQVRLLAFSPSLSLAHLIGYAPRLYNAPDIYSATNNLLL